MLAGPLSPIHSCQKRREDAKFPLKSLEPCFFFLQAQCNWNMRIYPPVEIPPAWHSVAVTAQDLRQTLVQAQGASCARRSENWRKAQDTKTLELPLFTTPLPVGLQKVSQYLAPILTWPSLHSINARLSSKIY